MTLALFDDCRLMAESLSLASRESGNPSAVGWAGATYAATWRIVADGGIFLKLRVGLRRVRLRRPWNVSEQFYLAATAQNLKRLVRFLAQRESAPIPCST